MFACLLWGSQIGLCVIGEPEVLMKKWFNHTLTVRVCVCPSLSFIFKSNGYCFNSKFKTMKMDGWKMDGKEIPAVNKGTLKLQYYTADSPLSPYRHCSWAIPLMALYFNFALISDLVWHSTWALICFCCCLFWQGTLQQWNTSVLVDLRRVKTFS